MGWKDVLNRRTHTWGGVGWGQCKKEHVCTIGGVGAELTGRKMMLAACSLSREQRGALEGFSAWSDLQRHHCAYRGEGLGGRPRHESGNPASGLWLGFRWRDGRWAGMRVIGVGEGRGETENYRRWGQEGLWLLRFGQWRGEWRHGWHSELWLGVLVDRYEGQLLVS